jgi:hypothetical protein
MCHCWNAADVTFVQLDILKVICPNVNRHSLIVHALSETYSLDGYATDSKNKAAFNACITRLCNDMIGNYSVAGECRTLTYIIH